MAEESGDRETITELWERTKDSLQITEAEKNEVETIVTAKDDIKLAAELTTEGTDSSDLRRVIDEMTLPQRLKLALFGNKQCRAILVFDSSRIVQEAVLKNPRLQLLEVEELVKNTSLPEQVFRGISKNREWMRTYSLKKNFIFNPKAPLDLTMRWISFLNSRDMKDIARSKNLPQVLVNEAKKRTQEK